nr:tRNA uridine-5-carboxymethylaminomethyl(34) synthesis GTPase MnmE [Aureimonas mangrovi]
MSEAFNSGAGFAGETIVALSSGALPSGVAVLRASGPGARDLLVNLAGGVPEARRASLRTIRDSDGQTVDRGLVLFFPGPNSVTGEDLAEFHLHGSRATVSAFITAACAVPGVRLAEAGEFTRRAFVNGRIDLTEAEGLADLLAAETDGQRRRALTQTGGRLRALYEGWGSQLLEARALLEADFDFADEGEVSDEVAEGVAQAVETLASEIEAHLAGAGRGELMREGFRVALAGSPNAGKSSLLNALAGREAAIVTDIPGTTRDLVEVTLDLGGVLVRLTDTAGLRDTSDAVEAIGVARARDAMARADLVLLLVPPGEPLAEAQIHVKQIEPDRLAILRSKADLDGEELSGLAISVRTGSGLGQLERLIAARAQEAAGDPDLLVPTRARHRAALEAALAILREAPPASLPPEILAENLRRAAGALEALTGRQGVEDLLDVIFSQFCIGK